ncbi:MAG: cytochrome C [bacterium]|nr:cytochrome C [bacterium]
MTGEAARIRVYLDDAPEPIAVYVPPAAFSLDTSKLADGEHALRIEANDATGRLGVRHVPFVVRNGPGITVGGLRPGSIVHGVLDLTVNAFGSDEPFEPRRAESRSPIPVWTWVLILFIAAWAAWYAAEEWRVPPEFAKTPTYATGTLGAAR